MSSKRSRRDFLHYSLGGLSLLSACAHDDEQTTQASPSPTPFVPETTNPIFQVSGIPDQPFTGAANRHAGIDALLDLLGRNGLALYRSSRTGASAGTYGLIAAGDVVLIKVNAQWKYRGCTNSDVVRGLIQRLLEHPDGFTGEIVIVENGQGRGSLACDTSSSYGGDTSVRANANDERHSYIYLVDEVFRDARVSYYLFDPIRGRFITDNDHTTEGYRLFENVSYPCFTTRGGRRVELREGIWNGTAHTRNLKLINVPVLKHHDTNGSEITGAVKHFYGLVSMSDGNRTRHYQGLGDTCGRMIASVRTPVISILDCIWVSHRALTGTPGNCVRLNQLLASQDPVALDYWAAKNVLSPIDGNARHAPDHPNIDRWLTDAMKLINDRGGLFKPEDGIRVQNVTKTEAQMRLLTAQLP
ncbi:MAG: DUF362 domain-containing protein [Vicinamibacteria bacterium]|nr:DUF362 domain-containing protein [Vicinamibacteria bacterium]